MELLIAAALCAFLFIVTILFHSEALRALSLYIEPSRRFGVRSKMVLIMFGIVLALLIEISLYAIVLWFADIVVDIGDFTGPQAVGGDEGINYFYFSVETFTSLGMGDIYPNRALRMVASLEVLNGLLLIGWSTSYTFVVMARFWTPRAVRHD